MSYLPKKLTFLKLNPRFSISIDNTGQSAASNTITGYVMGSGVNGLLAVTTSCNDSNPATRVVSGITFGGVALTKACKMDTGGGSTAAELWYLLNPTASTANIVVTRAGGSSGVSTGAMSLFGVAQTVPDNTNTANGSSSSPTVSITPTVTGCFMLAGFSTQAVSSITGTGNTSFWRQNISGTNTGLGGYNGPISPIASTTITCSMDHGDEWRIAAATFAPAAISTPFRTIMGVGI